jgi:Terpene cyclase DEP1
MERAMPDTRFDWILAALGAVFAVVSFAVIFPQFADDNLNLVTAVDGMFANPYAAGASVDIIFTYLVLAAWVIYEYQYRGVQHGWISLVIGLVIGVAAGLVVYLLVRHREIGPQTWR